MDSKGGIPISPAESEAVLAPPGKQEAHVLRRKILSRELLAYLGPGFIVTVGFIDPGNWATNLAGGAEFRYDLLWVITLSTLMLILMQNMAARLGAITSRSLAENCRLHFPAPVSSFLGGTTVVACLATALAEYLGGALGLYILLGVPLWLGVLITAAVVLTALLTQQYERLERLIGVFLAVIAVSYIVELIIVQPEWPALLPHMVVPSLDSQNVYVAMGMLGAVVMPHNIYLHSSVIRSRDWRGSEWRKARLLRFEFIDTVLAMGLGWAVNSSMIIVAASVFFRHGVQVTSIEQAAETLRPLAGDLAGLLFAVALLCSGIGSSMTASLAGSSVVTGFLGKSDEPGGFWFRASQVAMVAPVLVLTSLGLDSFRLLILSQVILSIQLPLTVIPLLILVRRRSVMGRFASSVPELALAVLVAVILIALNGLLLYRTLGGAFSL